MGRELRSGKVSKEKLARLKHKRYIVCPDLNVLVAKHGCNVTFVNTDYNIKRVESMRGKRIRCDTGEKGRDINAVLDQYSTFVKSAFDDFILPTKKWRNSESREFGQGGEVKNMTYFKPFLAFATILRSFRTPLWRNGPLEKPVLCNACGSRWRTKGTIVNYTPLHSRPEDGYDDHRIHHRISIRHSIYDNVFVGATSYNNNNQGFRMIVDEDTSNRSSSGSAISNTESCAQFGVVQDASDLTGWNIL
ncbi:hypothetical protein ACFE04_005523 [Oxalis oulophora]